MGAVHKLALRPDSVGDAARNAMEKAEGRPGEAAKLLESSVRSSRSLRDALTEPLISAACMQAVGIVLRHNRAAVWAGQSESVTRAHDHVARVEALARGTLLMFPLSSGKPLGQCTREEIVEAANMYRAQAKDMGHKARWLDLVAQSISGERTVAEVLTEKRLRELQDEAGRHEH